MKTKHLLSSLLLTVSTLVTAQNSPFNYFIEVSPAVSFALLNKQGEVSDGLVEAIRDSERPKFNLNFNFGVEYALNSRASIGLGLGYLQTGMVTKADLYITQSGDPLVFSSKLVDRFHNLRIPLFYQHNLNDRYFVRAGVSAIYTFGYDRITTLEDNDGNKTKNKTNSSNDGLSILNLGLDLAYGYNFIQNDSYDVYLQPYLHYHLFGVMKDVPLNRNMLNAGITAGFRIK